MSKTTELLSRIYQSSPEFHLKGGLCLALVITRQAHSKGLPLDPDSLLTKNKGQVAGLGKAPVQTILRDHGFTKVLAKEGGRTSRGKIGLMRSYVDALNQFAATEQVDLVEAEAWWVDRVKEFWNSKGPEFSYDHAKSLRLNIEDIFQQAKKLQNEAGGTTYVGTVLQHLVGAKLDLVMGAGAVAHHGASVADGATDRPGDFLIEGVAIHVTTHPSEGVVQKCQRNINAGLKPLIITLSESMAGAHYLLGSTPIADRVDVLDATQFLTANIYEHSLFKISECQGTLVNLLERYNEIVVKCETDPRLIVRMEQE